MPLRITHGFNLASRLAYYHLRVNSFTRITSSKLFNKIQFSSYNRNESTFKCPEFNNNHFLINPLGRRLFSSSSLTNQESQSNPSLVVDSQKLEVKAEENSSESSQSTNTAAEQELKFSQEDIEKEAHVEENKEMANFLDDSKSNMHNMNDMTEYVAKLRGLPWSATVDDITEFIGEDIAIRDGNDGVHLITTPEGRASGEAFVDLMTEDDLEEAVKRDRKNMGHRYIEVFKVKRSEMNWVLRRRPGPAMQQNNHYNDDDEDSGSNADFFVRLRGLPYECTKQDIANFFHGLEISPNGIHLMVDGMGRNSGEAYARFSSIDATEKALQRDRNCIGHRYIEVFRVGPAELKSIDMLVARSQRPYFPGNNRPGPYDRGGGGPMGGRFGGGGNSGWGGGGNRTKYFNKGFEEDNWNSYANEVGSYGRNSCPPPPPPPPLAPLIPGLKRPQNQQNNFRRNNNSNHNNSQNNTGGSGNEKCQVLMRGLPFRASEDDIRNFFQPLEPSNIHIIYEDSGRPSGNAKVAFSNSEEMNIAMGKHKERMDHRYIELFTM